jgi:hypothetical protein
MEELMRSFGLFPDEDFYWFVTEEDHVRGNFLVITYPDRIIVHKTIKVIQNKIYYTDLFEVLGYENAKETVARMLRETKEKLTEMRLEKIQRDF